MSDYFLFLLVSNAHDPSRLSKRDFERAHCFQMKTLCCELRMNIKESEIISRTRRKMTNISERQCGVTQLK